MRSEAVCLPEVCHTDPTQVIRDLIRDLQDPPPTTMSCQETGCDDPQWW